MKEEPFALLGINSDKDQKKAQDAIAKNKQVTRSWWDTSTGGPIAKRWGVYFWPTIYVLDGDGRVRYTGVRNEAMDEAVDALIKEMKQNEEDGDSGDR